MNNGRINLSENNSNNNFFMIDKIPVISNTNYKNILSSDYEKSNLSNAFFSQKNINNIQNDLKYNIYIKSDKKYLIDEQPEEKIVSIMRYYYLEYSKNLNTNIENQINNINHLILTYLVNSVYSELISYLKYKEDISNMYTLWIDHNILIKLINH